MKDLFLGRLLVLSVVILLSELSRLERVHESTGECAKQNGGGEETQFRGFPEASRSFIYITSAKEIGNVYNDITCSRAAEISLTLQSVTYVSVPFLGPYSKAPSWCRSHRIRHNRPPPYELIVFIVVLVLLSFCSICFASTVSSTPSSQPRFPLNEQKHSYLIIPHFCVRDGLTNKYCLAIV